MLSVEEGALLVKTARVAVETHLSGKELQAAAEPSPSLREERGVFVTLLDHANGGNLRGCIWIRFPSRSLLEQVRIAAVEAATSDSWLTRDVRGSRCQGQVFAEEKPNGRVFERRLKP